MVRVILKIASLGALVLAGSVGVYLYHDHYSAERQIQRLEQEKEQLQRIVQRLSQERRVAEVLVTDQRQVDGHLHTTLLFVEYARDGSTLPPRLFTIEGNMARIEAMVIKFEHDFIVDNDPLRGHSIALFTNLYGEFQAPADGHRIDQPGQIPDIYRGADPQISRFERELWDNFWKLAEDPGYRDRYGVRIAQGEGVWGPFVTDRLYIITLETAGGLNIQSEPLRGIYREALQRRPATAD